MGAAGMPRLTIGNRKPSTPRSPSTTPSRQHPVRPAPTVEDLAVFYTPAESEWQATCASMLAAGFTQVTAFNPYWEVRGRTYEDRDGYRIVLQQAEWSNVEAA